MFRSFDPTLKHVVLGAMAAMLLAAPATAAGPQVFRDDVAGFQIAILPGWTTEQVPSDMTGGRVMLDAPDSETSGENCSVIFLRDSDTVHQTQDQINAGMRNGEMLRKYRGWADAEQTVVGGGPFQLANGVVGVTIDKTEPISYLFFFQSTFHLRELIVHIPGRGYIVTCGVRQDDFASHRRAIDQIFSSLTLIPGK
jgi:hypothetical protein